MRDDFIAHVRANAGIFEHYIKKILDIKKHLLSGELPSDMTKGPLMLRYSDTTTRLAYVRSMFDVLPVINVVKARHVIDVGSGFGTQCLVLRYAGPIDVTALDIDQSNLDFVADALPEGYGYSHLVKQDFYEHRFDASDLVFLRRLCPVDWNTIADKLSADQVSDVVIIESLLKYDRNDIYQHIELDGVRINRFEYRTGQSTLFIPTAKALAKIFADRGYIMSSINHRDIDSIKAIYTLHFTRIKR